MKQILWIVAGVLVLPLAASVARAQQGMPVVSPEVSTDHHIVFRILAPQAKSVSLRGGDIQGLPHEGPTFTKEDNGVWSATVGPVDPGAYRYERLWWMAWPPWTRVIPR